jgi:hypothetical protein
MSSHFVPGPLHGESVFHRKIPATNVEARVEHEKRGVHVVRGKHGKRRQLVDVNVIEFQ